MFTASISCVAENKNDNKNDKELDTFEGISKIILVPTATPKTPAKENNNKQPVDNKEGSKVQNPPIPKDSIESQPKPAPTPEPKPQPRPNPQPKPEPQPSPNPQPKPEPQPRPNPEPHPKPQPDPQPDKPIVVQDADNLKIGHWNILNYPAATYKNEFKVNIISYILNEVNLDVVGLTEINNGKWADVQLIVDKLNSMSKRNYKMIYQDSSHYNKESNSDTQESVVILYDSLKVSPLHFNDGSIEKSFNEPISYPYGPKKTTTTYVRPPFGVMFKVTGTENVFTTIFDHLDSPGARVSKKEKKFFDLDYKYPRELYYANTIGSQEGAEAYNLDKVVEYFKNKGAQNVIFGGDTNIPAESSDIFVNLAIKGYLQGWGDAPINSTSLRTASKIRDAVKNQNLNDSYANPYDRMFYDSNAFTQNPENQDTFKYDIVRKFFEDKNFKKFFQNEYLRIFNTRLNEGQNTSADSNSFWYAVRSLVSDHLLVWLDLKFK